MVRPAKRDRVGVVEGTVRATGIGSTLGYGSEATKIHMRWRLLHRPIHRLIHHFPYRRRIDFLAFALW